jgi:Sulfotransferase family
VVSADPRRPLPASGTSAPTVLYIMGCGRSGSTLLERVLGAIPGFVNAGELVGLFRRVVGQDQRCGCGLPFSECPFWTAVGNKVFGGWDLEQVAEATELENSVARQRRLPQLVAPSISSRRQRAALAEYGELHRRLYEAILAEAGGHVLVDASKWPAPALALRHAGGVDLRVLHLVRDVRGVAYSWSKTAVARPHSTKDGQKVLSSHAATRTAANWLLVETEAAWLRSVQSRMVTIRYEDFVAAPRDTLTSALFQLGLAVEPGDLNHVQGRTVSLGTSHGVGGNPSRFRTGDVPLRVDDAWRSDLDRRNRFLTTAIGLPHLLRHRYPVG